MNRNPSNFAVFALTLSMALLAGAPLEKAHAFYGKRAAEAILTYDGVADLALPGRFTVAQLNRKGAARTRALKALDDQVQHLMGTFQSVSFQAEFGYAGVLGEAYEIRFTKVAPGSDAGRKLLGYTFRGKVVFDKKAFSHGPERGVPIKLPLAPDLIYDLGVERGKNRCTDPHYDGEGDFWYFWDPDMQGCPLEGDDEAVFRGKGRLVRLDNTRSSYPEYDRLYGDNGNGDTVEIAAFFGYVNYIKDPRVPDRRDHAKRAFTYLEKDLRARGFEVTEAADAFREYADGRRFPGIAFLRRYEKTVRARGRDVRVRVLALLADTDIDSNDATFHRHLVPAFRDADVLLYDGHSGLGGALDLGSLPDVGFRKGKYQVFFFNGCSSYPYFNGQFLKAKGGSLDLDVVTSGLPTYSDTAGPNVVAFLDAFVDGETRSWQRLLSELEESNGENGTYLTGVNGDEDNRFRPRD